MTLTAPPTAAPLYPEVDFPEDPGLSELPNLFNPEWVWETFCQRFERPERYPERIRVRQFSHSLGRSAIVSYEVEWYPDDYLPSQHFTVRIDRGKPAEVFQYPDDPLLTGLSEAAHPETALRLLNRHVLAVGARRVRVEVIRYRPGSRAVLVHSLGRLRLYARVMRPDAAAPLLAAREPIGRSSFVLPRLAGYWADGGVMWMPEIPGRNLRRYIRRGHTPDPAPLLDGLETLWAQSPAAQGSAPFNLASAYGRAMQTFKHKVHREDAAFRSLTEAAGTLAPFVKSWQPTAWRTTTFTTTRCWSCPTGESPWWTLKKPGRAIRCWTWATFWRTCVGGLAWDANARTTRPPRTMTLFRDAALERFRWSERELALREAVCLFRTCTNTIRHPQPDWRDKLEGGLALVNETLG